MTYDELKSELTDIHKEFEKKIEKTKVKYALTNNPYVVGDIFTDHVGSIIVEKIKPYMTAAWIQKPPCCVYFGTILNKDMTPNKRGDKREAIQLNDVKKG